MAPGFRVDDGERDPANMALPAAAAQDVLPKLGAPPLIGVVLGSGLGAWAARLERGVDIPYSEIPFMPEPKVAGHAGQLRAGFVGEVPVACLSGRVHGYEGHPVSRIVFGVRLLAQLGCRAVLLTNAAGGIRSGLVPGSLMAIIDHINLTGLNPLAGALPEGFRRFVDMTNAYDPKLVAAASAAADAAGIELERGVYVSLLGPSYETAAEIRMLRALGADAVGMSTALETIALRERGVAVGAVSCITNYAAGLSPDALDHDDVQATAQRARGRFEALLDGWVVRAAQVFAS